MNEFVEVKKKEFLEKFKWFFNSNPNESIEMLILLDTALHQAIAVGEKRGLEESLKLAKNEHNGVANPSVRAGVAKVVKKLNLNLQNHDTKKE